MKNDNSITLPRYFIYAMVFMMMVPLLSGCSVGAVATKSVSYAVSKYCEVPEAGRKAVRAAVGRAVSPNKIEITCVEN
jgi:hypothetical protein